jgi:hypothetical protein
MQVRPYIYVECLTPLFVLAALVVLGALCASVVRR